MTNAKRVVAVVLIIALCWGVWPHQAHSAALVVEDLGVLAQMFLAVAAMAELVGLNVRDLAAMSSLGTIMQLVTQLQTLYLQLVNIADQVEGFAEGWDTLGNGPSNCSASGQSAWVSQALQFARQGTRMAIRVQSILSQITEILQTLINIAMLIPLIGGTTSGLQMVSAFQAKIAAAQEKWQMATAPFHLVVLSSHMIEQSLVISGMCLRNNRFVGWGTYP